MTESPKSHPPLARAILKCNKASASYPPAKIQWTKDGQTISEGDVFMNSKVGQEEYGDLYILNVMETHAGYCPGRRRSRASDPKL